MLIYICIKWFETPTSLSNTLITIYFLSFKMTYFDLSVFSRFSQIFFCREVELQPVSYHTGPLGVKFMILL